MKIFETSFYDVLLRFVVLSHTFNFFCNRHSLAVLLAFFACFTQYLRLLHIFHFEARIIHTSQHELHIR